MDASVKEIPSRYAVAVDEADFETVASCFTEDATYEIHVEGQGEVARLESRESIRDFNADAHAELSRRRRHIVTNITITSADAQAAELTSYLSVIQTGQENLLLAAGICHDLLRQEGGTWRISHRRLRLDGPLQ